MKKIFSFTLALTLCPVVLKSVSADVPLVKNGQPLATIYSPVVPLPEAEKPKYKRGKLLPEPKLATAVGELNYHLQKMTGAALPVVKIEDGIAIKGPAIVLGAAAIKLGAVPQKIVESQEGFRLLTKGDRLLIGGQSDDAVIFGVYEVLEKLGCDWVLPGKIGEIIPQKKTVTIPNLDESQAPDFLMRCLWYRGYNQPRLPEEGERFYQWLSRQKGGEYSLPAAGVSGHGWNGIINRHKEDFEKDPTMYALRRAADGTLKRMGPQIETTHPRVIELFVQDIEDAFKKNNWPKDKEVAFGIGPADGLGYSLSLETQLAGSGRIDPIVGEADQTDILVLLANNILEKLGPEYPNVYLGCYSYSVHADYPMRYQPNPHYVQIFAPINFSRFHAVTDEVSKTQVYYRGVVLQWGKLSREQGNPLMYRGYNWNLAENMMPYSKLHIWGEELPFYKAQNIIGLNVEATKQWSVLAPSDWLFMKLAWNANQDWKKLLHEYCAKAYGAGAAPMETYWLRLTERQRAAGQEAGSYWAFPLMYDDAFIAAAKQDFAEAKRLAQTANDKTRIDYVAGGVEALRLYLEYFRATERFDFAAAKAGYDAMLAHWQKQYDQNTDLVANEAPAYLKRFIAQFVEQGVRYSSDAYSIIEKLPDEMPTIFDPNNVGHSLNYHHPEINDTHFGKTKTFSSTWDAQGLTGIRTGSVWYRHHFTLPTNLKGKAIGLFLGGMEDEARVYLNGKLIGSSGVAFSKPAAFDLTDDAIYGGENVLAIQVVRNGNANEIGLGGLLRPSFVFTGPRLETKAPKPFENRRVLPGGELGDVEN
jgi:hypothetical protein